MKPLVVEEVPDPSIGGPYEVVVEIAGSGVCHTDVHVWRGEAAAVLDIRPPIILGHEPSGYVKEAGDGVPEYFKPGTPVLVCSSGFCEEEDEYTMRGLHQLCGKPSWPGLSARPGAFAEYLHVPHYKYLIPARGLEDLEAASVLTDAGATAYRAVSKASERVYPDDYVVVVGLGGVGIFGAQIAARLLNARVIGVDVSEEKLRFAEKAAGGLIDSLIDASQSDPAGAVRSETRGKGVRAVIDFVGTESTMATYLPLLSKRGIYVIVGLGAVFGPNIPSLDMILGEKAIVGNLWASCSDVASVVGLARRGLINYRGVVSRRISIYQASEAIEALDKGLALGRQVITSF